jgi:hypothetical protein
MPDLIFDIKPEGPSQVVIAVTGEVAMATHATSSTASTITATATSPSHPSRRSTALGAERQIRRAVELDDDLGAYVVSSVAAHE